MVVIDNVYFITNTTTLNYLEEDSVSNEVHIINNPHPPLSNSEL
jgi:hypothetical protein